MIDEHPFQPLCGWRGIDDTQRAMAAGVPTLTESAPHLVESAADSTDPILLYKAWRDVLGQDPAYPAQQIGDCTSFGHGHANDLLQCIEISMGEPAVFQETDTEFLYAIGREVAGILGHQDGGYGSAVVKAMSTIGMVSRKMLGSDGTYSGQRAKQWGATGAPATVKAEASPFKLGSYAHVTTWDELVAALKNGYPVSICTARGFNLNRDQQGFCRMQGSWGHCMFIAGVRFDRPGGCIIQSWGPSQPAGPTALDQPAFSFWADQSAIQAILGEGDSWALSKSPEFEKRVLPPDWHYHDMA